MEYDNTNKGIISKSDRKESDSHPDIKGQINVEGVEYWLDGWQKTRTKDGGKFYSLSVKRKEPKGDSRPANVRRNPSGGGADDDAFVF